MKNFTPQELETITSALLFSIQKLRQAANSVCIIDNNAAECIDGTIEKLNALVIKITNAEK